MMTSLRKRNYWVEKIEELLALRSVLWLSGVRRSGKTTLCQSLERGEFFDCELPRVRTQLEDPETFFKRLSGKRVILDEIQRLYNPSEVLKIAADHFPKVQVVATGSSTLSARRKFKDTLTGRKYELWLTPSICRDLDDWGNLNLSTRMVRGGLPPFLLSKSGLDRDFQEWLDSFWAKDIQELFVIDKRAAFFRFLELLFRQSGQLFEAQAFSAPCEVSRQTIMNYLDILETTHLATVLRPYVGGSAAEIKSQPKVYGFDTGFVCYFAGIDEPDSEEKGQLLEHLTLNELQARFHRDTLFYWRNKAKNEIDFVVKPGRGNAVYAIECKNRYKNFDPSAMNAFRKFHPIGRNLLVALDVDEVSERRVGTLDLVQCPLNALAKQLVSQ
ncbi:MAG: ATP-binding protein [Deltaproteobacteria bacterium]|nr:ATP-binding protein [Deltaproteobacteria bacterium]MBI3296403.1 ATP-binding protein [Deltaproteobacteria bacterium]